MDYMPKPDDLFWSKVNKQTDGCWVWTASTRKGYGRIRRMDRTWTVHHLTWCERNGPVPDGLELDHMCHDSNVCPGGECQHRRCVNPDHIKAVLHADNRRRAIRNRCPAGHEYTDENSYINASSGGRTCRTCRAAARTAEKQRVRERKALGLGPGKVGRPRRRSVT